MRVIRRRSRASVLTYQFGRPHGWLYVGKAPFDDIRIGSRAVIVRRGHLHGELVRRVLLLLQRMVSGGHVSVIVVDERRRVDTRLGLVRGGVLHGERWSNQIETIEREEDSSDRKIPSITPTSE